MKNKKIDAVVLWVDGNDPKWQEERKQYKIAKADEQGNPSSCFRDYDLLEFFFRGIEKNMPWINNVFFITWGHLPKFLDTKNPRLKIVNHKDFIPKEYLPTYNSNVIELNLHRIKELSENFILFNDDMYVIDELKEEMFFKNDLVCDSLFSRTMVNYVYGHQIYYTVFNNMSLVNKHFYGHKPFTKWINPKYPIKENISNAVNRLTKRYSSFENQHLALAHKKSTFEEIWKEEGEVLDKMCHNKFRTAYDFSHWLMRYWRFAKGDFNPINVGDIGFYTDINWNIDDLVDIVVNKKEKIFLLNDSSEESEEDFIVHRQKIYDALSKVLPEKSSFELDSKIKEIIA